MAFVSFNAAAIAAASSKPAHVCRHVSNQPSSLSLLLYISRASSIISWPSSSHWGSPGPRRGQHGPTVLRTASR
jgi:hypothetical protein